MKNLKKFGALLLALVMVLSLGVTAFAEGETTSTTPTYSITIKNPQTSDTYTAYKIFDVTYPEPQTNPAIYSYTISTTNSWWSAVKEYTDATYIPASNETTVSWTGKAIPENGTDGTTTYTGNGLTLEPSAGDPTVYVVTGSSTSGTGDSATTTPLSAANFASYLSSKTTATRASFTAAATGTQASSSETVVLNVSDSGPGYYLVTCNKGESGQCTNALAELTTAAPTVEITDKNAWPLFDKKQTDTATTADGVTTPTGYTTDALDVQIGDTVYYQITDIVPDITGYKEFKYIVTDTLTEGLTLKTDASSNPEVTVKVGTGADSTVYPVTTGSSPWTVSPIYGVYTDGKPTTTKTDGGKYSSSDDGVSIVGLEISVGFVSATGYTQGAAIEITYSATVNEKAVSGVETNTAELTYSNDPGDSSKTATRTDTTDVYNAMVDVLKYGDANSNNSQDTGESALAGAQFVLYKTDGAEGSQTTKYYYYDSTTKQIAWNPLGDSETLQAVLADNYSGDTKITALTTGPDGKFSVADSQAPSITAVSGETSTTLFYFGGLEEGTYYLLETKAPDGYNLLNQPVTVGLTQNDLTADQDDTSTLTVKEAEGETPAVVINTTKLAVTSSVANSAGTELPSTGGMGTTIFYVVGGILVLGAAILLITRRRMNGAK